MPEKTPNVNEAAQALISAATKNGSTILMWIAMVSAAVSPVVLQQTYVNQPVLEGLSIDTPHFFEPGKLVKVDVSKYNPTQVHWSIHQECEVYGKNGSKMCFVAPQEGVTFSVSMIHNGLLRVFTMNFEPKPTEPIDPVEPVVEPVTPVVVPDPVTPEPDPEPIEAELDGVAKELHDLAVEVDLDHGIAAKIAKNLRSAVETHGDKSPLALLKEISRLNKPLDIPEALESGLSTILQNMHENGELDTTGQRIAVWNAMAEGLEAYSK